MAETSYYRYAEAGADAHVNWAEIGRSITDMLATEQKIRDDKKAEIDRNTAEFQDKLARSPLGKNFDDGNKFVLDFAADMQQSALIDDKLLKSGRMKLKDYTLRRQNKINSTNQIFDLQKAMINVRDTTMQGVMDGKLQKVNLFNMKNAESFGDLNNTKAVIDNTTGTVNISKTKRNEQTGLLELVGDAMPAGVLMRSIMINVPTYDIDKELDAEAERQGKQIQSILDPADILKAGSVSKYVGDKAIANNPQFQEQIKLFNSSKSKMIESHLADPTHIMSILTENTGKYDADSYTYDPKEEAASGGKKILLKIDPRTNFLTLDEDGKFYKQHYDEASSWVDSEFMRRLDEEVLKSGSTAAIQPPRKPAPQKPTAAGLKQKSAEEQADEIAKNLSYIYAGQPEGVDFFKGYKNLTGGNRTKQGFSLVTDKNKVDPYDFYDQGELKDFNTWGGSLIPAVIPPNSGVTFDMVAEKLKNYDPDFNADAEYQAMKKGPATPFAQKGTLATSKKGKATIEKVVEKIDKEFQEDNLTTRSSTAAKNHATLIQAAIPAARTRTFDDAKVGGDRYVNDIFMPKVLSNPLVIPSTITQENFKSLMNDIYDAEANGDKLNIQELAQYIPNFSKYNNLEVYKKLGYNVAKQQPAKKQSKVDLSKFLK